MLTLASVVISTSCLRRRHPVPLQHQAIAVSVKIMPAVPMLFINLLRSNFNRGNTVTSAALEVAPSPERNHTLRNMPGISKRYLLANDTIAAFQ